MILVCKGIGNIKINDKKDRVETRLTEFYRNIKLIDNYEYIAHYNCKIDKDGQYYEINRGKTIDKWYIIKEN